MANKQPTFFQRMNRFFGSDVSTSADYTRKNVNTYKINDPKVLFATKDKGEYDAKALELRQNKLLNWKWRKANAQISNEQYMNITDVKMMYRDADLMDGFPEFGTAADLIMEEACYTPNTGKMVNVFSKSTRIKAILEDLLYNRLQINVTLPMIARCMVKYGNCFMLHDIDINNGLRGWRQLPVYEVERYENMASDNPYYSYFQNVNNIDLDREGVTRFVWVGQNEFTPYWNWQISHFRLLYDSISLPFGTSFFNKARRHFRMLSMMEDAMLMYRLERAVERRVFKVNVAAIDEDDVPAYIEDIANEFKRAPIVDPLTGQLDLRRNLISGLDDFFIPTRDPNEPSPIETLPAAQNLTALDDIKYVLNKILIALRIPKPFLNFEESTGDGKNLSLMDVRFMRTINRIQQALLMELNKACIIHLAILGFADDLTNFSLTMNNPSSQAEMLEIENLAKKITTAKDAVTDNGNGIPLYSCVRAWKEILGWSEKEISDNLEELRLEAALAAELQKTGQIIKRTGLFDAVDNIYGEPGAEYGGDNGGEEEDDGMMGGGGGGGASFGGDFDLGGAPEGEDIEGAEGEMSMDQAAAEAADANAEGPGGGGGGMEMLSEALLNRKLKQLKERKKVLQKDSVERARIISEKLIRKVNEKKTMEEERYKKIPLFDKSFFVNEELDAMSKHLEAFLKERKASDEE